MVQRAAFWASIVGLLLQLTMIEVSSSSCARSLTVNETLQLIYKSPEVKAAANQEPHLQRQAVVHALMRDSRLFSQSVEDSRRCHFWDRAPHYRPVSPRKFPCAIPPINQASSASATSVHQLKPSDISVIAAMGDSISAGTGIASYTALSLTNTYRGMVYSIGGDASFSTNPTLANILKLYNPKLTGYAHGKTCRWSKHAGLDVSRPGDKAHHMPYQARLLVKRIQQDKSIDQKRDWKMVTLFIGGNDLCSSCKKPAERTPAVYTKHLKEALDILHQNLNRTFVNLVGVLDVSQISDLNCGVVCAALHVFECSCATYINAEKRQHIRQLEQQYQRQSCQLASSDRYAQRDDFAVVFQPFFVDSKLPRLDNGLPDISYFAPDCFHLSAKGHTAMALSLWNNLFEPLPSKRMSWHVGEEYSCPTEAKPYFATAKNSGPAKCPTE